MCKRYCCNFWKPFEVTFKTYVVNLCQHWTYRFQRIASNHQVSIVRIELELESKNMNIFVNGSFTRKNFISVTYYSISLLKVSIKILTVYKKMNNI